MRCIVPIPDRHSRVGGNLQGGVRQDPVILASRQYLQGGAYNKTTPTALPLSLDGRGIKGEGENDALHRPNPRTVIPA